MNKMGMKAKRREFKKGKGGKGTNDTCSRFRFPVSVWGASCVMYLLPDWEPEVPIGQRLGGFLRVVAERKMACLYCTEHIAHLSHHGQLTHSGKCAFGRSSKGAATSAPRAAAATHQDVPLPPLSPPPVCSFEDDSASEVAAAPQQPSLKHPFASDADWELAQLVAHNDGLSKGLLDSLLKVFAMGGVTFANAYEVFKTIDDLDGVDFHSEVFSLDPIPGVPTHAAQGDPVAYTVFHRKIADVVSAAIRSCPDMLLNPGVHVQGSPTHLTEAFRYQTLLQLLREVTGIDDAVLVPLLVHSGGVSRVIFSCDFFLFFLLVPFRCSTNAHLICADETPLTFFNASSEACQAYPVYLSIGLLPGEELLKPSNNHVVGLLPSYSDLRHKHCWSTEQHAVNRCLVAWKGLTCILVEFLQLSPIEEDKDSFLFLGHFDVGSTGQQRPTYAVPLVWLAGVLFVLLLCFDMFCSLRLRLC